MQVKVTPSNVSGSVSIPSSKSISHRAIICASLAKGTSTISNITYSKDIDATISCMRAFGAHIETSESSCVVTGTELFSQEGNITCDCCESGSTLRFLIPVGACTNGHVTYLGKGRLLSRPMKIYETIFKEQGLLFNQSEESIQIEGHLKPQTYQIDGNISSQFISGLLFVLPLLKEDSVIEILPPYESKSYVDLTLDMLKNFGVHIEQKDEFTYFIPGNQEYKAHDVIVEGDYSQMAFFGVLSALNQTITCTNMNLESHQGDKAILDQLKNAGCTIEVDNGISVQSTKCIGQTIDLANCPDLGPILCVLASYSKGTTHIINAQRLRMKESDRIEAMESELKKWNVDITSTQDSITIVGKEEYRMDSMPMIFGHNDHRIVMAMTVFGLCANTPCIIDDAQAITKSYPTFFEDIQSLGGKVEVIE